MAVLPLRIKPAVTHSVFNMDRFAEFVIRRRKILLWGTSLITIALIACIPRNELNDQYVNYFDRSVDFRRATDFAVAAFGGLNPIDYSLPAGQSGGISNPAYLQKLEQFAEWLRSQPDVTHVDTITDVMKRLNKNMHGDDPAWYRIPDSRELAAQYLLLYEISLPFGLDLNNQINVDKSATRLTVTLKGLPTTKEMMAFEQRSEQWLRENTPPTMHAEATGSTIMFAYLGDRNIRSMLKGNIISLLLISLVVIAVLRSLKIGLISLIPNLVPAGLAFGVWGIMVGQVGLSLSAVATMTYGIVVDDTIHFLSKYLHGRRKKGMTVEDAVRYAFSTVGLAAWLTSLILVAGFSVLVFSAFELNSGMGLLTAITIAFAALCDLFLLPPLLLKLEGEKYEKSILAKRDSVPVPSEPLG
jgi:predicted RND superfamily exporter protein